MTAIALSIAGSDPSGGAGVQADLKTFAAYGVYGAAVLTALTVQNTRGVFGVHAVPPDFVRAQANAVLEDLDVRAIKVGMLGDVATIRAVAALLRGYAGIPVVLDPVMVAASGDPLLEADAVDALRAHLLPLASVATPNIHEAALLLGVPAARDGDELANHARELRALGPGAVLVKGGRMPGTERAVDAFATTGGVEHLTAARVPIERPHGTGCTLSSAIAAGLALGLDLGAAVREAKAYVTRALAQAAAHRVGTGARPLLHERR